MPIPTPTTTTPTEKEADMKNHLTSIVCAAAIVAASGLSVLALPAPAIAAVNDHAQHAHGSAPDNSAMAEGLVKKIDPQKGTIVITHGPLPNGMPAMTMGFRVKEAKWISQIKEGQKIRFAAEDINGIMTIVRYEPTK